MNSDTQVTATVGPGAVTGKVTLKSPGGTATGAGKFHGAIKRTHADLHRGSRKIAETITPIDEPGGTIDDDDEIC